jgi:lysophospholipase L1-like esterase
MLQNLGVNGYTTDDLIEVELPQLGTAADLVTLAIGANDIVHGSSPERYGSQLHHIVTAIVASGARHLVALPQPDWSLSPAAADFGAPSAIHAAIVQFNAILQKETVAAGGVYVDLFPEMEAEAQAHMLALDGLHPSAAAYDAWGATLALRVPATCE